MMHQMKNKTNLYVHGWKKPNVQKIAKVTKIYLIIAAIFDELAIDKDNWYVSTIIDLFVLT